VAKSWSRSTAVVVWFTSIRPPLGIVSVFVSSPGGIVRST
jgi:hypothetical protein